MRFPSTCLFAFAGFVALYLLFAPGSFSFAAQEEVKPVEMKFPASADRVWSAALRALQERGEPILSTDESSGVISTDYRFESKKIRFKFTLLVTALTESTTKVSVHCVLESRFSFMGAKGVWDPKKSDGKREGQLLHDIERHVTALPAEVADTRKEEPLASSVQIKSGMTQEEVTGLLGEPKKIIKFDEKIFLRYPDITVELQTGKVVDVRLNKE